MARTKASPKRRTIAKSARRSTRPKAESASPQLEKLRKTIVDLRKRLERETRARGIDVRALKDTRKARDLALRQANSLKRQAADLSRQIKKALGDAGKREQARRQALAKIAELRAEVTRRKQEVARKSGELARLARESAGRARRIITSDQTASPESPAEPAPEESHDPS